MDRFAEELAGRLSADTILFVTGDHGSVDVPDDARVDLDEGTSILNDVVTVGGEPRADTSTPGRGATDDVLARWSVRFGDRMWVGVPRRWTRGCSGPTADEAALARTRDVVAIATGEVALVRRATELFLSDLRGQHGALTAEEALVPLVIVL